MKQDAIFQDTLGGTFNTGSVTNFSLSGFNAFSNIASGTSQSVGVGFNTAMSPGTYNEFLLLSPTSTNASSSTSQAPIRLNLRGEIVPEPGSFLLLTLGGGLLLGRRRRGATALAVAPRR